MNKRKLIPIAVGTAIAVFSVYITALANIKENKKVEKSEYSQEVVTGNDLVQIKADIEDKGVIRKYNANSMLSEGQFDITYVNEKGKLKSVKLKDVYVLGDVQEFEGANIIVKSLNKEVLSNEQINIVSYALAQGEDAKRIADTLIKGETIEIGFIIGEEEEAKE